MAPLRAPFKPNVPWCSLSLPTTFFCSERPHSRCCLSSANQLRSIRSRRARGRLQPCTANARERDPVRETVWKETTARISHWVHEIAWVYSSKGRKADVCSRPGADYHHCKWGEAQESIYNPRKHPGLLNVDQMGKKGSDLLLGAVKPRHIAISLLNMSDTSEFVAEH